jgi:hypothetical protein
LVPLAVGASAVAWTIFIRALAVIVTVNFVRHEGRLGRAGAGFWIDLLIIALAISVALLAHLIDIGVWAVLFVMWRIFGVPSPLLPFSGQLHHLGVR